MGRKYTVTAKHTGLTAAQDLIQITVGSDRLVKIAAIHLEQSNRAGDAQAQQLELKFIRGTTGGGGAAVTARPHSPGDTAYGGTGGGVLFGVQANQLTGLTETEILCEGGMNIQAGWHWTPPQGYEWEVRPSAKVALTIVGTPAAATDFESTIEFEELG